MPMSPFLLVHLLSPLFEAVDLTTLIALHILTTYDLGSFYSLPPSLSLCQAIKRAYAMGYYCFITLDSFFFKPLGTVRFSKFRIKSLRLSPAVVCNLSTPCYLRKAECCSHNGVYFSFLLFHAVQSHSSQKSS